MAVRIAPLLVASGMLAACASVGSNLDASPQSGPASAPTPRHEEAPVMQVPAILIESALADAERRTSSPRAGIKVLSAEAVTWADGSLGCPQPGMLYTQALIPGYRILLQVGTETLNYHARAQGPPVFCPVGRVVAPLPAADDPSV